MNNCKITFGEDEKESKNDGYNYMDVSLDVNINNNNLSSISFSIFSGYPEGMFDMNRTRDSKTLTLKEAEILVEKLKDFIQRGKKFSELIRDE